MKHYYADFKINKVYFVRINGEKVVRKMILSNEELSFEGEYRSIITLKRTFTIAGIGEIIKQYCYKGCTTYVNGKEDDYFTYKVYTDLNGTELESVYIDHDEFVNRKFFQLHNIIYKQADYGIYYAFVYVWDGMKPIKTKIYLHNICNKECVYSLIAPSFNKDDLKQMGYYLNAEDCEKDNVIEVIDFSF